MSDTSSNPRTYIHPVWRGIGCLMLAFTPVMGWALADLTMEPLSQYFPVPPEMRGIPPFVWKAVQGIPNAATIFSDFYVRLSYTFLYSVVLFGVFTVLYSVIYRASGGGRGSPLDAPMPKQRPRRRR